jgi:hypothetical protein
LSMVIARLRRRAASSEPASALAGIGQQARTTGHGNQLGRHRPRYVPADAPMRLHLEWRNGTIDQATSWVVRPAPAEVRAYADSPADLAKLAGSPLADEPHAETSPDPYAEPA